MKKCAGHLYVQIDQSIYTHLERIAEEKQVAIPELINRFIILGLTEERKGPLYFEEDGKKVRMNLYAPSRSREEANETQTP